MWMSRISQILAQAALVAWVGGLGSGLPVAARAAPAANPVQALAADVARREVELRRAEEALRQAEREAEREAADIERLKAQPPGVARDLQLQQRLADAQERAEGLSRRAAQLRQQAAQLRRARQDLIQACDRLLSDGAVQLGSVQRVELLRLRAVQAEALAAEESWVGLQAAVRSAQRVEESQPDDPRLLRERADLLRDSADKVRREIQRIEQRVEELARRRRLRERAAAVDEDLFAEQVTSRRASLGGERARAAGDGAGNRPEIAAPSDGPGRTSGTSSSSGQGSFPAQMRSGLDPATMDLLRQGDGSVDPEVKLQALRRAQADLERMAAELARRAAALDRRSNELGQGK
ncbi:MAG: hypothetical protein RMK29_09785 [Myxococcales bacterium]|nr:hypothetical protein [Myxococcota bacterium]MDW8281992.1 hypothetical protein [Myxococcales bacterium]